MDDATLGTTIPERHVKGGEDQLAAEVVRHRPADNPATEDIEHDGEVQEP
jgi:hypothetical protein